MTAQTFEKCIADATLRLRSVGIEDARREARLLLAHALGTEIAEIIGYPERSVPNADEFLGLVDRRAGGVPMAQLLERREFWSLEFRVTADTLDPRPDSETLVEAVLAATTRRRDEPLRVLDLGTGTGCLLLSVLSELPAAEGIGVDLSFGAIAVARDNATALGMADRAQFLVADWTQPLVGPFDIVLSNPPYIPSGDIDELQPEVADFEPRQALDGGADGLSAYRRLAASLPGILAVGGISAFEVGIGQWRDVADLLRETGLRVGPPAMDLGGVERCVICHCDKGVNQKKVLERGHEPSSFWHGPR